MTTVSFFLPDRLLLLAALIDWRAEDGVPLDVGELQFAALQVALARDDGACDASSTQLLAAAAPRKHGRRAGRRAVEGSDGALHRLKLKHVLAARGRSVAFIIATTAVAPFAYRYAADWTDALFAERTLSSTDRYVALHLCREFDRGGAVARARLGLAELCFVDRKTVLRALRQLAACGLLDLSEDVTARPALITVRAVVPANAAAPVEATAIERVEAAPVAPAAIEDEDEDAPFEWGDEYEEVEGPSCYVCDDDPDFPFNPSDEQLHQAELAGKKLHFLRDAVAEHAIEQDRRRQQLAAAYAAARERASGQLALTTAQDEAPRPAPTAILEHGPLVLHVTGEQYTAPWTAALRALCVQPEHTGPSQVLLDCPDGKTRALRSEPTGGVPLTVTPSQALRAAIATLPTAASIPAPSDGSPIPAPNMQPAPIVEPAPAPTALNITVTPEQLADLTCIRKLRAAIGDHPGPTPVSLSVIALSAVGERRTARKLPLTMSEDSTEQMRAEVGDELKGAVKRWRHAWDAQEQRRQHDQRQEGEAGAA